MKKHGLRKIIASLSLSALMLASVGVATNSLSNDYASANTANLSDYVSSITTSSGATATAGTYSYTPPTNAKINDKDTDYSARAWTRTGVKLTGGEGATFDLGTIDISKSNWNGTDTSLTGPFTSFIEFSHLPNKAVDPSYPELKLMTITLTDAENSANKIDIQVSHYKHATTGTTGSIVITAKATGQKSFNAYRRDGNPVEQSRALKNRITAGDNQNGKIDVGETEATWLSEDGGQKGYRAAGAHALPIYLVYDKDTNTLYSPLTSGDAEDLKVSYAIRAFDGKYDNDVTYTDDGTWNGFSGDMVNVSITFDTLLWGVETTSVLVNSLGGHTFVDFRVAEGYKGYVNQDYVIPAPELFINGEKGEAFSGTYSIKKGETAIKSDVPYVEGATYKFDEAGEYVIEYVHTDADNNKYTYNYTVEIYTTEELEGLSLTYSDSPTSYEKTIGMSFNVGAVVKSSIYYGSDLSTVELSVTKPNKSVDELGLIGEEQIYTFADAGEYVLKYVFKDALSEKEEYRTINVTRNYYALEAMDYTVWSYGDTYNAINVNKEIVSFYDAYYGRNFFDNTDANVQLSMKVKTPTATDYVDLTDDEIEKGYVFAKGVFGNYDFKYSLTYDYDGTTYKVPEQGEAIEFTVEVKDSVAPTIFLVAGDYVMGASKVNENDKTITYNVIKGETVTFGELRALDEIGSTLDYTDKITLSLIKDGDMANLTEEFNNNREAFTYTFDSVGTYMFKFDVTDGVNSNYICIIAKVEEEFYTISSSATFKDVYNTNELITVPAFEVLTGKGAVATDVTKKYVIARNGETVGEYDSLNYSPDKSGNYTITLKAVKGTETVCEEVYSFTAEDKTAPEISINGTIVKEATVGTKISIASIIGVDNETLDGDIVNSTLVTLNGTEVNTYKGQFTPIEAGVYKVKLTSTDLNGNVSTYVYEIKVANNTEATVLGMPVWSFVLGIVGVVALIGAVVIYLFVFKKSRKSSAK